MAFLDRRFMLKGMLHGACLGVGLPLLDIFLDGNGEALAATGRPLPIRFGTWHWGCGLMRADWHPSSAGADYDMPGMLAPLLPFQSQLSLLSNFRIDIGSASNVTHFTGNSTIRTGAVAKKPYVVDSPSFENEISQVIGNTTRFRTLDVSCVGTPISYSWQAGNVINTPDVSPLELYSRIFLTGFRDPNRADFTPDANAMAAHSVLSVIAEQRDQFVRSLGSADRRRMDQYFTSLRQVEQQLALEMKKPDPAVACSVPLPPAARETVGAEVDTVRRTHKLFVDLLLMAVACDQTRVFNIVFSDSNSTLRKAGLADTHHALTHTEIADKQLGYQKEVAWFTNQSVEALADFLGAAASIREGDRSLLDSMLVLAHSDVEVAQLHTIDNIPMMLAGSAGGRVKGGHHIDGKGDLITRVGLACQQAMGVTVSNWGTEQMQTSKSIAEVFA